MEQKELLINSVSMVRVHDNTNVPTVLFYSRKGEVLIGSKAFIASRGNRRHLNADFKIDLGKTDPKAPKEKFPTASGEMKSANVLTFDFLSRLSTFVDDWLTINDAEKVPYILLAEPLALEGELAPQDWLSNYRRSLERILYGEGKFEKIDFLPEPFAVFQYYRYGQRHPIVSERAKQYALVIDFGGGTFDVCIVETTKEGEISQSGRNSRPLAASSIPVGGFFINRTIVEELFRSNLTKEVRAKFHRGLESYRKWRDDQQDMATLAVDYQNFVHNFHEAIYLIEEHKLNICKTVSDWKLDSPIAPSIRIQIPEDPFSSNTRYRTVHFSAPEMRNIFVNKIWEQHLKPTIKKTFQRGKEELKGAEITVVLLSGGSANIGWLKELLQRDFEDELSDVEILHLSDYQEVVAKGLAIECARRFYAGEGDFTSVTYNRLCLVLNPDSYGDQIKTFVPKTPELPPLNQPGVLLPSASVLRRFLDKPMRWQVRLDRPPRKRLDYFFLRSSLNPDETQHLQNVTDNKVFTPPDCHFDSSMLVQLTVSQDGTSRPKFIYKRGRTEEEEVAIEGRAFALDMTYSQIETIRCKAYIGLDFGTSNTSVSYIDERSINTFKHRSSDKRWHNLSDLISTLPYPLAEPLSSYIIQTDQSKLIKYGFSFIESALTIAAYITYLDYCMNKGRAETKLFKNLTQRSAGPLWALFQNCFKQLRDNATISSQYKDLLGAEFYSIIDATVNKLASYKHEKIGETAIDILTPVQILANISQKVFSRYTFGFFDQVKKKKFGKEHEGLFRHARGRPPFTKVLMYQGLQDFSEGETFLLDSTEGIAFPLTPLIFKDTCGMHPDIDIGHFYLYDKEENDHSVFSFKAVGFPCTCEVSLKNEYRSLAQELIKFKDMDQKLELIRIGKDSVHDIWES